MSAVSGLQGEINEFGTSKYISVETIVLRLSNICYVVKALDYYDLFGNRYYVQSERLFSRSIAIDLL